MTSDPIDSFGRKDRADRREGTAGSPGDFVRPFLVTGGRTKSAVEGLRLETLVQRTPVATTALKFESAAVYNMSAEPIAIAELSAHLELPIATIKVIVGDLINSGHLKQHKTVSGSTQDPGELELITRLIDGVRRL